jgi:hypothetical protein
MRKLPKETEDKAIPERGAFAPFREWVRQMLTQRETMRKSAPFRVELFLLYPFHYRKAFAFSAFLYLLQHG